MRHNDALFDKYRIAQNNYSLWGVCNKNLLKTYLVCKWTNNVYFAITINQVQHCI